MGGVGQPPARLARGAQGLGPGNDSASEDDNTDEEGGLKASQLARSALRSFRSAMVALMTRGSKSRRSRPQTILVDGRPQQLRVHLRDRKPQRSILRSLDPQSNPTPVSSGAATAAGTAVVCTEVPPEPTAQASGRTTPPTPPAAAPQKPRRLRFADEETPSAAAATAAASKPAGAGMEAADVQQNPLLLYPQEQEPLTGHIRKSPHATVTDKAASSGQVNSIPRSSSATATMAPVAAITAASVGMMASEAGRADATASLPATPRQSQRGGRLARSLRSLFGSNAGRGGASFGGGSGSDLDMSICDNGKLVATAAMSGGSTANGSISEAVSVRGVLWQHAKGAPTAFQRSDGTGGVGGLAASAPAVGGGVYEIGSGNGSTAAMSVPPTLSGRLSLRSMLTGRSLRGADPVRTAVTPEQGQSLQPSKQLQHRPQPQPQPSAAQPPLGVQPSAPFPSAAFLVPAAGAPSANDGITTGGGGGGSWGASGGCGPSVTHVGSILTALTATGGTNCTAGGGLSSILTLDRTSFGALAAPCASGSALVWGTTSTPASSDLPDGQSLGRGGAVSEEEPISKAALTGGNYAATQVVAAATVTVAGVTGAVSVLPAVAAEPTAPGSSRLARVPLLGSGASGPKEPPSTFSAYSGTRSRRTSLAMVEPQLTAASRTASGHMIVRHNALYEPEEPPSRLTAAPAYKDGDLVRDGGSGDCDGGGLKGFVHPSTDLRFSASCTGMVAIPVKPAVGVATAAAGTGANSSSGAAAVNVLCGDGTQGPLKPPGLSQRASQVGAWMAAEGPQKMPQPACSDGGSDSDEAAALREDFWSVRSSNAVHIFRRTLTHTELPEVDDGGDDGNEEDGKCQGRGRGRNPKEVDEDSDADELFEMLHRRQRQSQEGGAVAPGALRRAPPPAPLPSDAAATRQGNAWRAPAPTRTGGFNGGRRTDTSYADLSVSVQQAVDTVQVVMQRRKTYGSGVSVASTTADAAALASRSHQIRSTPFASAIGLLQPSTSQGPSISGSRAAASSLLHPRRRLGGGGGAVTAAAAAASDMSSGGSHFCTHGTSAHTSACGGAAGGGGKRAFCGDESQFSYYAGDSNISYGGASNGGNTTAATTAGGVARLFEAAMASGYSSDTFRSALCTAEGACAPANGLGPAASYGDASWVLTGSVASTMYGTPVSAQAALGKTGGNVTPLESAGRAVTTTARLMSTAGRADGLAASAALTHMPCGLVGANANGRGLPFSPRAESLPTPQLPLYGTRSDDTKPRQTTPTTRTGSAALAFPLQRTSSAGLRVAVFPTQPFAPAASALGGATAGALYVAADGAQHVVVPKAAILADESDEVTLDHMVVAAMVAAAAAAEPVNDRTAEGLPGHVVPEHVFQDVEANPVSARWTLAPTPSMPSPSLATARSSGGFDDGSVVVRGLRPTSPSPAAVAPAAAAAVPQPPPSEAELEAMPPGYELARVSTATSTSSAADGAAAASDRDPSLTHLPNLLAQTLAARIEMTCSGPGQGPVGRDRRQASQTSGAPLTATVDLTATSQQRRQPQKRPGGSGSCTMESGTTTGVVSGTSGGGSTGGCTASSRLAKGWVRLPTECGKPARAYSVGSKAAGSGLSPYFSASGANDGGGVSWAQAVPYDAGDGAVIPQAIDEADKAQRISVRRYATVSGHAYVSGVTGPNASMRLTKQEVDVRGY